MSVATRTNIRMYTPDKETVLLKLLEWFVFTPAVEDLIAGLLNMDLSNKEYYKDGTFDINALLAYVIDYIFTQPEGIEQLVIELLSWYDITYADSRFDLKDLEKDKEMVIDEDKVGVTEAELEELDVKVNELISGVLPAVVSMLRGTIEGALGITLNITSTTTITDIINQIVSGIVTDDLLNGLFGDTIIGLLGGDKVSPILEYVKKAGIDVTPSAFLNFDENGVPQCGAAIAEFFSVDGGYAQTWADVAKKYKGAGTKKVEVDLDGDTKTAAVECEVYTFEYADGETAKTATLYKTAEGVYYHLPEAYYDEYTGDATTAKPVEGAKKVTIDFVGGSAECDVYTLEVTEGETTKTITLYKDANGFFYEKIVPTVYEEFALTAEEVATLKEVVYYEVNVNWNVTGVQSAIDLVIDILVPFIDILDLIFLEEDLTLLDGITLTGGDGWDRGLIPLLELLGAQGIYSKAILKTLTPKERLQDAFSYIWDPNDGWNNTDLTNTPDGIPDGILNAILAQPATYLVEALPRISFYLYTNSLQQALEQFIAPVTTLLNNVKSAVGLDVVAGIVVPFILSLVGTDNYTIKLLEEALGIKFDKIETLEDLIAAFITGDQLTKLINYLLENITTAAGESAKIEISKDLFKTIVENCGTVKDTLTARVYGAHYLDKNGNVIGEAYDSYAAAVEQFNADRKNAYTSAPAGTEDNALAEFDASHTVYSEGYFDDDASRYIEIINVDKSSTIVYILGDLIFGQEVDTVTGKYIEGTSLLEQILGLFDLSGAQDILDQIIPNITGENRYALIQILVQYFLH